MKRLLIALLPVAAMAAAPTVVAVNIDSIIDPVSVEIVDHAISQAENENAAAVLVRLNTPGGLLDSAREIDEKIVSSKVPVIGYVTPSGGRAASAGFFLLEAADVAAMAPATNTGASSPVSLTGDLGETEKKKVENDTSAWLRGICDKRGRNPQLAETTITDAKSFSAKEALDDHLADLISPSEDQLMNQLDGRQIQRFDGRTEVLHTAGARIVNYDLTPRERIVSAVADPNIGFILLILGAIGVYVEFTAPGLIFPGVLGGIMALLGLSSLAVLPINWIGAALLILGATLFVLEAKFTSHGILGIGGAASMVLGALLLVNGPPSVQIHLNTALGVTIPFALITIFLVSLVIRARANKAVMSNAGMMDELGEARTTLAPLGKVFVHGEYWDAVSSSPIPEGAQVRVVGVDGLKLKVEPAEKA